MRRERGPWRRRCRGREAPMWRERGPWRCRCGGSEARGGVDAEGGGRTQEREAATRTTSRPALEVGGIDRRRSGGARWRQRREGGREACGGGDHEKREAGEGAASREIAAAAAVSTRRLSNERRGENSRVGRRVLFPQGRRADWAGEEAHRGLPNADQPAQGFFPQEFPSLGMGRDTGRVRGFQTSPKRKPPLILPP